MCPAETAGCQRGGFFLGQKEGDGKDARAASGRFGRFAAGSIRQGLRLNDLQD